MKDERPETRIEGDAADAGRARTPATDSECRARLREIEAELDSGRGITPEARGRLKAERTRIYYRLSKRGKGGPPGDVETR